MSLDPTAPTPAPISALGVSNTARGFLFDLDGVLTQTTTQHRTVWKLMFDGYVVGVDRVGQTDALRAYGADVVVCDLVELLDRS